MDVSVIMAARDAQGTIHEQLEALCRQTTTRDWELIVVDDASVDATVRIVESYTDRVPSLRVVSGRGKGPGSARNLGATVATGRVLLFTDADDVVADGWLERLASGLGDADLVGGVIDHEVLNTPMTIGARGQSRQNQPTAEFGRWPRTGAANLGIRADVFERGAGFDEDLVRGEDTDLCIRLQVQGYRFGFVEDAVVFCRHRTDLLGNLIQVYRSGRVRPLLYRRFRPYGARRGVPGRTIVGLLACSWWLVAGTERRATWLGKAAGQWGRIVGSVEHRVVFL